MATARARSPGRPQTAPGCCARADTGVLFLDEIGELGLDEQAMILRAIEDKRFLPVGADREVDSDFQLIAGTNRDLAACVAAGTFRDDLYARLNLWTFALPGLAERREDIAPNLDYELDRHAEREGDRITFNKEARDRYLAFATSAEARWPGNFRDLAASVTRMATFSPSGRINVDCVTAERSHGSSAYGRAGRTRPMHWPGYCRPINWKALDPFDRVQLAHVVATCRVSRSLSEAGRTLFAASLRQRTSTNDADRLRKYLARFDLSWTDVMGDR
ncbi:MAG: sigma 54-interacting transcriptional regulator [Sphingomonas taxi]